jgi:PTS system mannose-specific IIA component
VVTNGDHPFGVVVVTHGQLASELLNAAEMIVGDLPGFTAVSIGWQDPVDVAREAIERAIARVDRGSGVLLLTDMFGGTPSNLAISVMDGAHVEVVAGANLPMLIKLASVRDEASLEQAVTQAAEAGRKYIYVASKILCGK